MRDGMVWVGWICLIAFVVVCRGLMGADQGQGIVPQWKPVPWIVYFGDEASLTQFKDYEIIVLDRLYHPPVRPLVNQGRKVFGYMNLGEVEDYTPWYQNVKDEGILLVENENWPGSYMVDLRDPRWAKRVIEEIIPFILFKGFNGLFLDTLDNASYLEELDPVKYAGMQDAAVALVELIRLNYPDTRLMVNRGLQVAQRIAPHIDYLIGEVLLTQYNFSTKRYFWNAKEDRENHIALMEKALTKNPKLQLLSLDYWNPQDSKTIRKIYEQAKALQFSPYVGTVELDMIVKEPV